MRAAIDSSQPDRDVMAEINITPFTDVLLVLLIIFMILAALAAPPGFQKQLSNPTAAPSPISTRVLHENIQVVVSASNQVFIDGKPAPLVRLYPMMAQAIALHKRDPRRFNTHISVLADAKASYFYIIKILDSARQAGDDDVGFVTE